MDIDETIHWLKEMQGPAMSEAELYCAGSCYGTGEMAYSSPEDYALDEAINGLEQVKEYRQLEEQDRLIKLPCKVGDDIYSCFDDSVQKFIVKGIHVDFYAPYKIRSYIEFDGQGCCGKLRAEELGRTLFLAKGEAEAKLKELRGDKNDN